MAPDQSTDLQTAFEELNRSSDDLGLVLRADFLLESALTQKCRQIFPNIENVYKKLNSSLCCNLLELVEAPEEVWRPCKTANRIRNEFAHGDHKSLTLQHVKRLSLHMSAEFRAFAEPEKMFATLPTGEKVDVPLTLLPNRLYFSLAMLQYAEVVGLTGSFSTLVSDENSTRSSSWTLVSSLV